MTCKLCKKEKKLIKSHIIPKFLAEHLRDEKQGIIRIDNSFGEQSIYYPKSFEYEKLLCFKCDNKVIGELDTYASTLFNNNSVLATANADQKIIFPVVYRKFKLFLLSILWRSSVASRFFWSNIKLEQSVEKKLRHIILNKVKLSPLNFPCLCFKFEDNKIKNPSFIHSPIHIKNAESEYFMYIFGGIMWLFFLRKDDFIEFGDYPLIKDNDKLTITKMDLKNMSFLPVEIINQMRAGITLNT